MRRNHLKGQLGNALNVVLAAAGYNLGWLMQWLISFCVRFPGGQVRMSLQLLGLIEPLLSVPAALSSHLFQSAG